MKYKFKNKLWMYKGTGGWCFVTLPKTISKKIRKNNSIAEEGWGRLKVMAHVAQTSWETSIWFDTKFDSYLLPVKGSIRKKEKLEIGPMVSFTLTIGE